MRGDSPNGGFLPTSVGVLCRDNEAPLDHARGPLVFLHCACRRRCARRPRGRDVRPVFGAFSRRSGAPQPTFAQRCPDRESGRRNRIRHADWEAGSTASRASRRCSWPLPVPPSATLCSASRPISRSCSSSPRFPLRSARRSFPSRSRSSGGASSMQAFTPPVAPSASCAPAGRLPGPSDPQSARSLSGRSGFAACSSPAPASAAIALATLALVRARPISGERRVTRIDQSHRTEVRRSPSPSRRLPCSTPPCSSAQFRWPSC